MLRVLCGEMAFELRAAGAHTPLPRPWLAPAWRREGKYLAGAALALLLVVVGLFAIPEDPRSLSLDDIGRTIRMDPSWTVPLVVPEPPPTVGAKADAAGGGGGRAAPGPRGQAGDKRATPANHRLAVKGKASETNPTTLARRAADAVKISACSAFCAPSPDRRWRPCSRTARRSGTAPPTCSPTSTAR